MSTTQDNGNEFIKKVDPGFGKLFLRPRNGLSLAACQELLLLVADLP